LDIRYTGKAAADADYSVGFVLTIELPNSKSWSNIPLS
jgi:hypothetical protein